MSSKRIPTENGAITSRVLGTETRRKLWHHMMCARHQPDRGTTTRDDEKAELGDMASRLRVLCEGEIFKPAIRLGGRQDHAMLVLSERRAAQAPSRSAAMANILAVGRRQSTSRQTPRRVSE
jgi:hypothetical protein